MRLPSFTYKDTLSVPRVEVHDSRVIHFELVEYPDMVLYDEIEGISVKPLGFLSAVFALVGKPDLKQNRVAVSARPVAGDARTGENLSWHLQDRRGGDRARGLGHEEIPVGRTDLERWREARAAREAQVSAADLLSSESASPLGEVGHVSA